MFQIQNPVATFGVLYAWLEHEDEISTLLQNQPTKKNTGNFFIILNKLKTKKKANLILHSVWHLYKNPSEETNIWVAAET